MKQYKHFCCKLHLVLALVLGLVVAPLYLSLSLLSTPVSASTYTASLSTSGTINLNVSASGSGANVTTDNLSIISTCPSGYNISIAGPTDSTLYKDGNSSNTGATKKILASSGTTANPLPIIGSSGNTSYTKTWGYTTEALSGDSPVTTSSNFIGLTSTVTTIATTNSGTTAQGTTLPVYYGVSIDNTIEPGTYTMAESSTGAGDNKITYYLTTSPSCTSYTVNFNPTSTAGGQTLTGTGTMNPQTIQEGVATNLTTLGYTAPTGYEFKEWNTSQDGTGTSYSDQQSVTDLVAAGSSITLYAQWKVNGPYGPCEGKTLLYDLVACRSKGTQTVAQLRTTITKPTSSDPSTDTSNSGVYEYDASVFGASSDASNDHTIYYYRGILDNNLDGTSSTYGSNGDGALYPNYVRLGTANTATCWRIIRTTGSGGVKLLYNGAWNTTTNSCANVTDGAQIRSTAAITAGDTATFTSVFGGTSYSQYKSIVGVGYTRNNTYASTSATTATAIGTLFGTNSNYSGNSTNSTIKGNIETWYDNNLNSYTSIIEPSAGYCNDRSLYAEGSYGASNVLPESTEVVPYGTNGATKYYFGSYTRNMNTAQTPSLTCPSSRNVVDLYTTSSASDGNKQLSKPVALLTADELSFAGSGRSTATQGSAYNYNSFARSGYDFWLLSPYFRNSLGAVHGFTLSSDGYLNAIDYSVNYYLGVRPSISLTSSTTPVSGSGTATDPWLVAMNPIYQVAFSPTSTAGGQTVSGTGAMQNQRAERNVATALNHNQFTAPIGYEFKEWNTNQDGTGTSYQDGQSVTNLVASGQTITLYAQWQPDPCYGHETELYCMVAAMSKGTQTAADLKAVITKPTSSDPSTDTSNSGVYKYDASVFGTASDASNDHKIYYYRGILDNNLDGSGSTYGSNGDGTLYPNYVKLGDTCWRIVRTTGSGGIKMIYNGLYSSGTTANSCANTTTDAQITTLAFGLQGNSAQSVYWYRNINRVGYTFNNTSSLQDSTTDTSVDIVFGSNSNYSTTNTENSNIKNYIENTWFTSSNGISAYESLLEPSAGYCNDRTAYSDTTTSTALTTIAPYATANAAMYFGAYGRNYNATNAGKTPSLTCPSSRNVVDLYTTSSASNGNKQLSKPVALLTADELSFAGSGCSTATRGSTYNVNSFARSGSSFWLLSPYYRSSGGNASGFAMFSNSLNNNSMSYLIGVRPSISLKSGTTPASGTGTATDPWVINAP